jgi:mRNA interferase HigB
MLIANAKVIDKAMKKYAAARKPLAQWLQIAGAAEWWNIVEARDTFPTADAIKGTNLTCFNIGGNSFRLIAIVSYSRQEIVIRGVLTHAEYTRRYSR